MMYNSIQRDLRNLVVGVNTMVPLYNGTYVTAVNFDNAATTPPFFSVLKEVMNFSPWYSSIHRGKGYKSMLSSDIYDMGREVIRQFVKADIDRDTVIFTKNTTESINTLANILYQQQDGRDMILSTWMEHSANDLPWRGIFNVEYVEVDKFGRLSIEDLETKLSKYHKKIKLVTVTGASNVTGYINPIHKIAQLAHKYGTKLMIDGAQLVPHMQVDMKPYNSPEHIDYLTFSAHKMYAPFGTGVLIGPKETYKKGVPICKGGGPAKQVTHRQIEWAEPPEKDEAGSPNIMGVVALIAAIKTLNSIGMDNVYRHEKDLFDYIIDKLTIIPSIKIYCHSNKNDERIGVIPFNIDGIHHQYLASILSFEAGIAVRNGFFCAHPYSEKLLGYSQQDMEYYFKNPDAIKPGMVRVSFGLYNNYSEIDKLLYMLNVIARNKNHYIHKYTNPSFPYRFSNDV